MNLADFERLFEANGFSEVNPHHHPGPKRPRRRLRPRQLQDRRGALRCGGSNPRGGRVAVADCVDTDPTSPPLPLPLASSCSRQRLRPRRRVICSPRDSVWTRTSPRAGAPRGRCRSISALGLLPGRAHLLWPTKGRTDALPLGRTPLLFHRRSVQSGSGRDLGWVTPHRQRGRLVHVHAAHTPPAQVGKNA